MTENKKHKFQPVIILQEELPLELPIYITTRESLQLFRRESPISEDLKRLLQQKDEASESDKPAI
jgi:hypothetical protein